jgi:acetyl-CoA carboxylase carboxyl transferase subunit beta
MVDAVVHRHDVKSTVARLSRLFTKAPAASATAIPAPANTEITAAAAE